MSTSQKSRSITFLLATFLGGFGAHRFYVGKGGSGVAQLLLSLTLVGVIISGPWAFVDWIRIMIGKFEDAEGNAITKW